MIFQHVKFSSLWFPASGWFPVSGIFKAGGKLFLHNRTSICCKFLFIFWATLPIVNYRISACLEYSWLEISLFDVILNLRFTFSRHFLQLWFLPNVERLFLDCFDMKEVPELIGRLQRLKVASFAFNKLEHLPRRMRFCKQLEELSVVHNHMNCLPKWLTKFPNFRHLKRTDMFIIQTSDKVPIRRIVAENDSNNVIKKNEDSVVYCPESLFLAASKAALKAHPYLGFPTSARDMLDTLPRTVMDALTFFVKEMKFCDHCDKPFFKEECKFYNLFLCLCFVWA